MAELEKRVEEKAIGSLAPGDCFEDEYETAYEVVALHEGWVESKRKFDGETVKWDEPLSRVYRVKHIHLSDLDIKKTADLPHFLRIAAIKDQPLPNDIDPVDLLLVAARRLERAASMEVALRSLVDGSADLVGVQLAEGNALSNYAHNAIYPLSVYEFGEGFPPPESLDREQVEKAQEMWSDGENLVTIAEALEVGVYLLSPWLYAKTMDEAKATIAKEVNGFPITQLETAARRLRVCGCEHRFEDHDSGELKDECSRCTCQSFHNPDDTMLRPGEEDKGV